MLTMWCPGVRVARTWTRRTSGHFARFTITRKPPALTNPAAVRVERGLSRTDAMKMDGLSPRIIHGRLSKGDMMGKRGPQPKPHTLRALEGNPGRRPLNKAAPQAVGHPDCPAHLGKYAQGVWERVLGSMPPQLYGGADREILAAYCAAVEMHRAAYLKIRGGKELDDPTGDETEIEVPSKWFSVAAQQATLVINLGAKLGLDPASRSSINVPPARPVSKFAGLVGIQGGLTA